MNNLNKFNDFLRNNQKINESLEVHDENELKSIFNLVLDYTEIYKLPYGHYSSIDFNIYIIHGRKNVSDEAFLQEMYNYHGILNHMYNLNFFHIKMTDKDAIIVLYDFIMNPSYNSNEENYLSGINKYKLQKAVPENIYNDLIFRNGRDISYRNCLTKGIDYSNGDSSNLSLFDWKYSNNKTNEDIKIPIKVGDTVLGGRFKNKKIVVKKIGKNKKGDITINDKPLLKFRIIESLNRDTIEEYTNLHLVSLLDEGFRINYMPVSRGMSVKIFKYPTILQDLTIPIEDKIFQWNDIKDVVIPFIEFLDTDIIKINTVFSLNKSEVYLDRAQYEKADILEDNISAIDMLEFRFIISL